MKESNKKKVKDVKKKVDQVQSLPEKAQEMYVPERLQPVVREIIRKHRLNSPTARALHASNMAYQAIEQSSKGKTKTAMIRSKIRADIDPRDWDRINDMAKQLQKSDKWKHTSGQFLQRDLSGKTFAQRYPEMVSSLYEDLKRIKKLEAKKKPNKGLSPILGETSISKTGSTNRTLFQMNSDLDDIQTKLQFLKGQETPDQKRARELLYLTQNKKEHYKGFIKETKNWEALNRFRDLEDKIRRILKS